MTPAWKDEYTLLCERCGYVVEGLPTEGECPECGKPIEESLPERRVGTPWQQKPSMRSYLSTGLSTLMHPMRTLASVRIEKTRTNLGVANMCVIGLVSFVAMFSVLVFLTLRNEVDESDKDLAWAIRVVGHGVFGFGLSLFLAAAVTVLTTTLTVVESLGLRFIGRRRGYRITPAIADVVCSHGAVGWVLATALAILSGSILMLYANQAPGLIPTWTLLIPLAAAVPGFLFFETFAWLGLRRCKFANRVRPEPSDARQDDKPRA